MFRTPESLRKAGVPEEKIEEENSVPYMDLTLPEEDYIYEVDYHKFIPLLIKGW